MTEAPSPSDNRRITAYADFWPYYLTEHRDPASRRLHYVGSGLSLALLASAFATATPLLVLAAVVSGYFFAWVGHFFFERNKPATFRYPFWSLISDFRMFGLWLAGRLEPELRKAGAL
ncbi:MAG: DUF962 domain-containing protein [Pseudomonadota bacterium]